MEYKDYQKNIDSFLIGENLYRCPICQEAKNKMGFLQHIKRAHFGFKSGGNNGKYQTKQFKEKRKEALEKSMTEKHGALKTFKVLCSSCDKPFTIKEREKKFLEMDAHFCSRSCANKREQKEITREKITQAVVAYHNKRDNQEREKVNGHYRKVVMCNCELCFKEFKAYSKPKRFCGDDCKRKHKMNVSSSFAITDIEKEKVKRRYYRRDCAFSFNVYHFPKDFDLSLIDKFGWYKAKNRGDNFKGVSRDHMFSVMDGYRNSIPPEIIKHPANCVLMLQAENISKKDKSTISIDQLKERIAIWDSTH
jgi:hypothetical protein